MGQPDWDITDEPSPRNVQAILRNLSHLEAIPLDAVAGLRKYITLLESENRRLDADNARLKARQKHPATGSKMLTVHVEQGQYRKVQPLITVTWVCQACGKTNQREQLPGGIPKYCQGADGELSACQLKAIQRKVDRQRAKRRAKREAAC